MFVDTQAEHKPDISQQVREQKIQLLEKVLEHEDQLSNDEYAFVVNSIIADKIDEGDEARFKRVIEKTIGYGYDKWLQEKN